MAEKGFGLVVQVKKSRINRPVKPVRSATGFLHGAKNRSLALEDGAIESARLTLRRID